MAVIDTGIDALHPDLTFGSKTVQNAKIVADPALVYSFPGQVGQPL